MMSTSLGKPNGALSLLSLALVSHRYMDVGCKDSGWEGISNYTRKSKTLAPALPETPGYTEAAQFIQGTTVAADKGQPRVGRGPSALWFAKAWVWG